MNSCYARVIVISGLCCPPFAASHGEGQEVDQRQHEKAGLDWTIADVWQGVGLPFDDPRGMIVGNKGTILHYFDGKSVAQQTLGSSSVITASSASPTSFSREGYTYVKVTLLAPPHLAPRYGHRMARDWYWGFSLRDRDDKVVGRLVAWKYRYLGKLPDDRPDASEPFVDLVFDGRIHSTRRLFLRSMSGESQPLEVDSRRRNVVETLHRNGWSRHEMVDVLTEHKIGNFNESSVDKLVEAISKQEHRQTTSERRLIVPIRDYRLTDYLLITERSHLVPRHDRCVFWISEDGSTMRRWRGDGIADEAPEEVFANPAQSKRYLRIPLALPPNVNVDNAFLRELLGAQPWDVAVCKRSSGVTHGNVRAVVLQDTKDAKRVEVVAVGRWHNDSRHYQSPRRLFLSVPAMEPWLSVLGDNLQPEVAPKAADSGQDSYRTWTSADGMFSVVARLERAVNDTVYLRRRDDGVVIKVALRVLSSADQNFVGQCTSLLRLAACLGQRVFHVAPVRVE